MPRRGRRRHGGADGGRMQPVAPLRSACRCGRRMETVPTPRPARGARGAARGNPRRLTPPPPPPPRSRDAGHRGGGDPQGAGPLYDRRCAAPARGRTTPRPSSELAARVDRCARHVTAPSTACRRRTPLWGGATLTGRCAPNRSLPRLRDRHRTGRRARIVPRRRQGEAHPHAEEDGGAGRRRGAGVPEEARDAAVAGGSPRGGGGALHAHSVTRTRRLIDCSYGTHGRLMVNA